MPTLVRLNRCRVAMYFDDHPPPHFHVITCNEEEILVEIENLAIWAGEADSRDTEEAFAWAAGNRRMLWARWMEYSEQE